mmetsp:Transcript_4066/g.9659  ORF Transcript_4066/g.9659 Transcript_4066/m.9659 type:complete len:254 (-) Transcript_4066:808-1569(-)
MAGAGALVLAAALKVDLQALFLLLWVHRGGGGTCGRCSSCSSCGSCGSRGSCDRGWWRCWLFCWFLCWFFCGLLCGLLGGLFCGLLGGLLGRLLGGLGLRCWSGLGCRLGCGLWRRRRLFVLLDNLFGLSSGYVRACSEGCERLRIGARQFNSHICRFFQIWYLALGLFGIRAQCFDGMVRGCHVHALALPPAFAGIELGELSGRASVHWRVGSHSHSFGRESHPGSLHRVMGANSFDFLTCEFIAGRPHQET